MGIFVEPFFCLPQFSFAIRSDLLKRPIFVFPFQLLYLLYFLIWQAKTSNIVLNRSSDSIILDLFQNLRTFLYISSLNMSLLKVSGVDFYWLNEVFFYSQFSRNFNRECVLRILFFPASIFLLKSFNMKNHINWFDLLIFNHPWIPVINPIK